MNTTWVCAAGIATLMSFPALACCWFCAAAAPEVGSLAAREALRTGLSTAGGFAEAAWRGGIGMRFDGTVGHLVRVLACMRLSGDGGHRRVVDDARFESEQQWRGRDARPGPVRVLLAACEPVLDELHDGALHTALARCRARVAGGMPRTLRDDD
ncbi:hypothetical protein [Burkholderia glumae]|uniref:hypothetical protein n=1 Tax=Burkholderia glumae TaxID=337 RepID=UPI003B9CE28C